MVIAQFHVWCVAATDTNNRGWHETSINGPCAARLIGYEFAVVDGAGQSVQKRIQLQSDVFRTPYSGNARTSNLANGWRNMNLGLVLTNGNFTTFDQSHRDYHWNNIIVPGRVQFSVIDLSTNLPLENTFDLILTFDIEELP